MKLLNATILIISLLVLMTPAIGRAQSLPPYAYQNPINLPQLFAPGIITLEDVGEYCATFSGDGREVYYTVRNFRKRPVTTIYYSRYESGKWSTPVVAPFSGRFEDADPLISPDGQTLIFASRRPIGEGPQRLRQDLWQVKRQKNGWSAPENLGAVINTEDYNEIYGSLTADGTLYFASDRPGGMGKSDIYRSRRINGRYQTPENVGSEINSANTEGNPFIDPQERFLIFYSARTRGYGNTDLYISYRVDGKWSTPRNLGGLINSEDQEFAPTISPDGNYFFFARAQGRKADIFQVDISALELSK